jgi:tetratricopeptide (TPR) repeat protein
LIVSPSSPTTFRTGHPTSETETFTSHRRNQDVKIVLVIMAAALSLWAVAGCAGEREATTEESAAEKTAIDKPLSTKLAEADQAFKNRQYAQAGEAFETVAGEALAAEDRQTYVEAAAMRAWSHLIQGNADDGRPWLVKAEEVADPSKPIAWSRYVGVRGRFEWEDAELEKATATFLELFDYCQENELYDRAVDAAHMVALTGDPEQKFEWAMKGIELAEKGNMTSWLGPLWNNLGWDYVDAGRYDEGRAAFEEAREYHYKAPTELPKLIADYSIAHVTRLQGNLDEARESMRAVFGWAEKMYDDGNTDAMEWMGFSRWELGEIAISKGEVGIGLGMLEKALDEFEQSGMPKWDEADWQKRNARVEELKAR